MAWYVVTMTNHYLLWHRECFVARFVWNLDCKSKLPIAALDYEVPRQFACAVLRETLRLLRGKYWTLKFNSLESTNELRAPPPMRLVVCGVPTETACGRAVWDFCGVNPGSTWGIFRVYGFLGEKAGVGWGSGVCSGNPPFGT